MDVDSTDRWQKAKELFEAALELEPTQRTAFLDQHCMGDPALRSELEALLANYDNAGSFMEEPAIEPKALHSFFHDENLLAPDEQERTAVPNKTPSRIGRYRLVEKIGEGGMGEVWMAEQVEPVRRRVALKLVKAGMNSPEIIARFESERQALALMDHPAIAKVLDAGSTPEGAPYFVMEYVAGLPITAYCDNHKLNTRERLSLLMQVCEGVQHAHQKAIIHRDLKPSNILVTEADGRPVPKIIDFGVAKALGQKLTADTLFTQVGAIIGTLEYMSPEQAVSSGEDIDTRTDVYSLGVIVYELLAGTPPLALRKVAFQECLRRLRDEEPSKPSTKIRTQNPETSADVARNRHTEPVALAKQLSGDLDAIVLKALEKDRSRRYGSAADLGSDIGRYLLNEPVLAVPPSIAYRTRKFARRYRTVLATASAFTIALILATTISIVQSIRATKQRDRADAEAAVAQAINDFLQNDLLAQASAAKQSGPSTKPDPDLKVRTALDRAATRIEGRFNKQPEVEAAIRATIGQTDMDLGLYPQAQMQLERALKLQRQVEGPRNPKTLKTMSRLGRTFYLQGRYREAEDLLSQTLESQRQALGSDHRDTMYSASALGFVYYLEGKYAPAEALLSKTLETGIRVLGTEHPDTLGVMGNLALVYDGQGKYAQSEALNARVVAIFGRVIGPEHPNTLMAMNALANVYDDEGKYGQAEALDRKTLEIRRRVLGPEHHETLISMNNLSEVYMEEGKYVQAEALLSQTRETMRHVLGPEHRDTLMSMGNLAEIYSLEGKYAGAEVLLSQTLDISRRVLGGEHPVTVAAVADFAFLYQCQRKYSLAEAYAAQALAARRHALGSEDIDTVASAADLALAYICQGKFSRSEPLAREALQFYLKKEPDDWERFRADSLLGASLAGQKRYAEAESLLLDGYKGMLARKERMAVPVRYHLDHAQEWLVQLYQAWNKPEEAAAWRNR